MSFDTLPDVPATDWFQQQAQKFQQQAQAQIDSLHAGAAMDAIAAPLQNLPTPPTLPTPQAPALPDPSQIFGGGAPPAAPPPMSPPVAAPAPQPPAPLPTPPTPDQPPPAAPAPAAAPGGSSWYGDALTQVANAGGDVSQFSQDLNSRIGAGLPDPNQIYGHALTAAANSGADVSQFAQNFTPPSAPTPQATASQPSQADIDAIFSQQGLPPAPSSSGAAAPAPTPTARGIDFGGNTVPNSTGQALSPDQVYANLRQAGFDPQAAAHMLAISNRETGGTYQSNILNDNPKTGDYSMGLFQINYIGDLGPARTKEFSSLPAANGQTATPDVLASNPLLQAQAAYKISGGGQNFNAWSTNRGLSQDAIDQANAVADRAEPNLGSLQQNAPPSSAGGTSDTSPYDLSWLGGGGGGGALGGGMPAAGAAPTGALPPSPSDASGRIWPLLGNSDNDPHATYHLEGGSDLMAPRGTPVVAMQTGKVNYISTEDGSHSAGGNAVEIHGSDGLDYYYAHFDAPSGLKVGDSVQLGQQIGAVGNTGNAWKGGDGATHLHMAIGHGINEGTGAAGGLGQNYDAQTVLAGLRPDQQQAANLQQYAQQNQGAVPGGKAPATASNTSTSSDYNANPVQQAQQAVQDLGSNVTSTAQNLLDQVNPNKPPQPNQPPPGAPVQPQAPQQPGLTQGSQPPTNTWMGTDQTTSPSQPSPPPSNPLDQFKQQIGDAFANLLGPIVGGASQAGQTAASTAQAAVNQLSQPPVTTGAPTPPDYTVPTTAAEAQRQQALQQASDPNVGLNAASGAIGRELEAQRQEDLAVDTGNPLDPMNAFARLSRAGMPQPDISRVVSAGLGAVGVPGAADMPDVTIGDRTFSHGRVSVPNDINVTLPGGRNVTIPGDTLGVNIGPREAAGQFANLALPVDDEGALLGGVLGSAGREATAAAREAVPRTAGDVLSGALDRLPGQPATAYADTGVRAADSLSADLSARGYQVTDPATYAARATDRSASGRGAFITPDGSLHETYGRDHDGLLDSVWGLDTSAGQAADDQMVRVRSNPGEVSVEANTRPTTQQLATINALDSATPGKPLYFDVQAADGTRTSGQGGMAFRQAVNDAYPRGAVDTTGSLHTLGTDLGGDTGGVSSPLDLSVRPMTQAELAEATHGASMPSGVTAPKTTTPWTAAGSTDPIEQKVATMLSDAAQVAPQASEGGSFLGRLWNKGVRATSNRLEALDRYQEQALRGATTTGGTPAGFDLRNPPEFLDAAAKVRQMDADGPTLVRLQQQLAPALRAAGDQQEALTHALVHANNIDIGNSIASRVTRAAADTPVAQSIRDELTSANASLRARQDVLTRLSTGVGIDPARMAEANRAVTVAGNRVARAQKAVSDAQDQILKDAASAGVAARDARQFPGDLNVADSQAALSKLYTSLGPEGAAKVDAARAGIRDFVDGLRSRMVKSGLVSEEEANRWRTEAPNWVPTNVLNYVDEVNQGGGGAAAKTIGLGDNGVRSYSIAGTKKFAENPLTALIDTAHDVESRARRNDAANAFVNLDNLRPAAERQLKLAPDTMRSPNQPIVQRMVDGKVERYLADPLLAAAVQGGKIDPAPGFTRAWTNFVRNVTTVASPTFALLRNPTLDIPEYGMRELARAGGNPLKTYDIASQMIRGYLDTFKGIRSGELAGPLTQEYLTTAGGGAGMAGRSLADRQAVLDELLGRGGHEIKNVGDLGNILKQIYSVVPTLAERGELGPRVASMQLAKQRGMTPTRAALMGRRVTMDFNEGGTLAKSLNGFIPFFNVGVQGSTALQVARMAAEHPVGTAASIAATVGAPAAAFQAWNRADPQRSRDYENVPQYLKDQGIVVMAPEGLGGGKSAPTDENGNRQPQFWWINSRGMAPFSTLARNVTDGALRTANLGNEPSPQDYRDLLGSIAWGGSPIRASSVGDVAGALTPQFGPGLTTALQLHENQDVFRQRQIVSRYTDAAASPTATKIAQALTTVGRQADPSVTIHPSQVDFAVRDMLGGVGQTAMGASDLGLRGINRLTGAVPEAQDYGGTLPQDWPVAGGALKAVGIRGDTGGLGQEARAQAITPSAQRYLQQNGVEWVPTPVGDTIGPMPLTRDEQSQYQVVANKYADQALQALKQDRVLEQEPDPGQRQKIAQAAVSNARQQAAADMMDTIPDDEYNRRLDRASAGQSLSGRKPPSAELVGSR